MSIGSRGTSTLAQCMIWSASPSRHVLELIIQQGVDPLNTLFDVSGKERRTGALNALGVQYARSNGSVDPDAVATQSAAAPRVRSEGRMTVGLLWCTVALYVYA